MAEGLSPSERLSEAYKRLAASADALNAASDEFTKPIANLDELLKRLNVGLTVWRRIHGASDDGNGNYWSRDVGYAKVDGKWGIAIRTTEGNHYHDYGDSEEWLFGDAPRPYRIEAIDKLPELVEELITAADKTAKKLKEKAVEARELASAVKQADTEVQQQRKERRK